MPKLHTENQAKCEKLADKYTKLYQKSCQNRNQKMLQEVKRKIKKSKIVKFRRQTDVGYKILPNSQEMISEGRKNATICMKSARFSC